MCWTYQSDRPHRGRMPRAAPAPSRLTLAGLALTTALAPLAWGTTYAVTTQLLPPHHPAFAAAARALPAGLLALALARRLPHGCWWWRSLVTGALNIGVFFPLLLLTAERLPGGVAATFGAIQPLVVAGLTVVVLHEPPSARRFAWGLLGLAGVTLVVLGPAAGLDVFGVVAGLAAAVSMALGVTLAKKWGRPADVSALAFAGWQLTAGGLVLLPVALVEGAPPTVDAAGLSGYLWLGLVGGLASYTLWFRGIGRLPVTSVAMLGLLSPIVAAAVGAAVLHETLTPLQFAGFVLALAAILGSQLPARRPAPRPSTTHHSTLTEGVN